MPLPRIALAMLLALAACCEGGAASHLGDAGVEDGGCHGSSGQPVCRAPSGIPIFGHVFVIPMENTSLATLSGPDGGFPNSPYLRGLAASWATASDYHGVAHPSLPNYLAMTSGEDVSGVGCDCQPAGATGNACDDLFHCSLVTGNCDCPQPVEPNLADALESAGEDWRNYAEGAGTPCNTLASGSYAPKHVPFLYYPDVASDAARCRDHVVDFAAFSGDLAAGPRAFSFLTPNLTDDMHDPAFPSAGPQNLVNGDAWLATQVPEIVSSAAFREGGVVFIVWDEDDASGGLSGTDNPIGLFVLSPFAKQGGYVSPVHADHYSLLATIEDGLGLPRLGLSAQAQALTDFFP
ncbi:MAG: alkaline phosphatase family protein [Deltaproteobacteria bacterium]